LAERFILKTAIQQEETEKTENERLKSSDLRNVLSLFPPFAPVTF